MKYVRQVKVKNALGLHTRPATAIVKLLQDCKSQVSFTYKKDTINAKSIMSILILAARKNSKITITAEGSDADEIIGKLVDAFDTSFGE
ncbi:MAG: HPr family phosphocarrier protein [Chlamydiales bacterium]|nr:HPr family phosphocarrier protein [Chlamydiales bacterium]